MKPPLMRVNTTYGPGPWYLVGRSLKVADAKWRFGPLRPDERSAGESILNDGSRHPMMAIAMYSYVHPLAGDRLLIWQPDTNPAKADTRADHMRFTLVDLGGLARLPDVDTARRAIEKGRSCVELASRPRQTFRLPVDLPAGSNSVELPEWLRLDHEILVLVTSSQSRARIVWRLAPGGREVEVIPQDWFNDGAFDFDFEWITRIGRNPDGRLVGDGMRLSAFQLDVSGRGFDRWLDQAPGLD
jgi:hypothetical protein